MSDINTENNENEDIIDDIEEVEPVELEGEELEPIALEGEEVEPIELEGEEVEPIELEGEAVEPIALEGEAVEPIALEGEAVEPIALEGEAAEEVISTEPIVVDSLNEIPIDFESDEDILLDGNTFSLDDFEVDEDGNIILTDEMLQSLMGDISTEPMEPVEMSNTFLGLSIIQFIVAILLMSIVLQQSKSATPSLSGAPIGSSGSYWSQNKGRSEESKLSRLTVGLTVVFFVLTLALGFLK